MVITQQAVTCQDLLLALPSLFVDSVGNLSAQFTAVASVESASSSSIIFMSNPKAQTAGFQSGAKIWVVGRKFKDAAIAAAQSGQTILIALNVERAMAATIQRYFLQTPYTNRSIQGVHSTAVVSESATLAPSVRIGPHAFIGANVHLGANVYIGACSVIEDDTVIGEDSVIHPSSFIGHSTVIGKRCEVHPCTAVAKEGYGYAHDDKGNHYRIPHQGRVVLEDDVHIGSANAIDRGTFGETRIKAGSKLDNKVHIAHNCVIGTNSLLTAGFSTAGSAKIGANFVTGGNSSVTGHIEICDNVQISGHSAVAKSISIPGQYGGYPLMPLQQFIKTKVVTTHLVEMQKQLKAVLKHLGLETPTSSTQPTDSSAEL